MVGQRYYSSELGRFIKPDDVSSLNPSSINGLNLYAYANNNPIGIAYSSSGVDANGGMVSSITSSVEGLNFGHRGTISNSSNIFGALGILAVGVGLAVGGIVGGVWAVAIGITAAVATYILWEGVDYLYDKIKEWIFE